MLICTDYIVVGSINYIPETLARASGVPRPDGGEGVDGGEDPPRGGGRGQGSLFGQNVGALYSCQQSWFAL